MSFVYLVKALGIYKATVRDRNIKVANTLNQMALVYPDQGKFELALELLQSNGYQHCHVWREPPGSRE